FLMNGFDSDASILREEEDEPPSSMRLLVSPPLQSSTRSDLSSVPRIHGHRPHLPVADVRSRITPAAIAPSPRTSRANRRTRAFRRAFFPAVVDKEWNDWRWQSRHRIKTLERI